ncbi:MAG: hypothetical protein GXO10_00125 [Crenarchaeota archaeon]|nr:hypothetical protein [Thermoproteota archaeon]
MSYVIPRRLYEIIRREADKQDLTIEEFILELALSDDDPHKRAIEYMKVAEELLEQAEKEIEKRDILQAAEKLWGATALAIKAYVAWKERRVIRSHRELWENKNTLKRELGEWVQDAWMHAHGLHTCFYENWCTEEDIREALPRIKKLIEHISTILRNNSRHSS